MKHRLQTLLKHKLQWLVLLTALLGVSQSVQGYNNFWFAGGVDNWTYREMTNVGSKVTYTLEADKTYYFNGNRNETKFSCNGCEITGTTTQELYHDNNTSNDDFSVKTTYAGTYTFETDHYNGDNVYVKITYPSPKIKGEFSSWADQDLPYTVNLSANTSYQFGVTAANGTFYKGAAITSSNCTNVQLSSGDGVSNATILTTYAGKYTFTWDDASKRVSVAYPTFVIVGESSGNWLNGESWANGSDNNIMTGSPLSITFNNVASITSNTSRFRIVQKNEWNTDIGWSQLDESGSTLTNTSVRNYNADNNIGIKTTSTLNITVTYDGTNIRIYTAVPCDKPTVSFDSPVTSVCSGTTQSYTALGATASGTIDSYTWGVSGTGWSRSGSGTSASATFNTGTGTGTITVTATNSCGSVSDAASQTVTIKGTPSAPSFSSGATKLCENVSENSYVITGTADAFIWENSGNGISWHNGTTPATSAMTAEVDVASSITDGATTYVRVKAQNCGSLNSDYATKNITLYKSASAGTVALSKSAACVGESGLTASTSGIWYMGGGTGVWSSTATNYATIDTDGNITALAAGSPNIKYTIKNPVCGSETYAQRQLTINGPADFSISTDPASGYTPWKPITLSTSNSANANWSISTDPSPGTAYLNASTGVSSTVFKAPANVSNYTVSATETSDGCDRTATKNITVSSVECE